MMWTTPPQPEIASLSNAFINAWLIVSNSSSGPRLGSHKASHMPNNCSAQVPATTKSSGTFGQPIRSIAEMKGSNVTGSNPINNNSQKLTIASTWSGTQLITCDYRFNKVRSKSAFIQQVRNHGRKRLWFDFAVFPQFIKVKAVAQTLMNSLSVSSQTGKTNVKMRSHFKNFLEICDNSLSLNSETTIGGDCYAFFAFHGEDTSSVIWQNRLKHKIR